MSNARTIAFVMDPIESVNIREDTTFALMLEAQRRGHRVLYIAPEDLGISAGRATALATPVTLRREEGNHVDRGPSVTVVLDDEVDLAFQRTDPPVDLDYVVATQILGTCQRTLCLNRPSSVVAFNEKLLALHFPELMPATLVSRNGSQLLEFMEEMGGQMILKPLDGRGGEGVFHVVKGDRNLNSILEQATRFGTVRAMAQEFLPAVREGDKRILLLEGESIGALLRVPPEDDIRANLHVGGSAARGVLSEEDERIVERIGPMMRREGLFFVGIDVIGGKLTEINVTSPTCIQEIDEIDGVCLEAQVLDRAEAAIERHLAALGS